ncbi:SNF2 family N-terminal domain-containing protein [Immersiella caudata]|uniref:SNF2 family N-terminal domain-containing protein n=1 Tax=Immersiella caudata TaxID=314043 RepID=A0AA39WJB3_9PEZI|nr:SNF2 family N-terminal domain-containing protein [Immersiella caudata]
MTTVARTLNELAGSKPDHVQKFTLAPKSVPHILLSLPDGEQFGVLRSDMTDVLEPLLKQSSTFELEAVASTVRLREQISIATKPNEAIVQVNINIYGPRDRAKEVGDDLSNRKQWLQKPDFFKAEYEYSNPHHLHFPELESQMVQEEIRQEVSGTAKPRAEEERVKKLVAQVHEALTRASDPELDRIAGDQSLKSKLYEHQQQALSYMSQRESGGIPEKYRLWKKETYGGQEMYIHRITRTRSPIRPEEMGGGVLADEMGLGKTLSTLALTVRTLEEGKAWAEQKRSGEHTSGKTQRYTHSTLVIVPSALLINNWMDEINEHTGDNTLTVLKYHGQGRERNPDVIANADIVITTYNTLATEVAAKKSLLHKIFWYRVVLDEAHIIRRPQTTFYRTCADLEARSRWCLTGTPIQNRLEDIGALFAFLRADPFHSLAQFRRFICIPFEQGETVARDRLILLYDSLVLRRTLNIISLPGQDERVRELHLTEEERRQYNRTFNILNRYMRTQVGQYPSAGSHGFYRGPQFDSWKSTKFGLFQAHLQLRILCNHGTFQKPFSWKKRDTKEELNAEREAFITEMGLRSELMCDGCKQPRPILGSTKAQNSFVEDCKHSLCHECLEDCQDLRHCPLCQRFGTMDVDVQDGQNAVVAEDPEGNPHHKDYFNAIGFSTKMNALMLDVKDGLAGSKSIIFSCWTRTLDLVAKHLRAEKIVFVRVDGEILSSKREGIIKRFADDKEVRVLLMTTGTGAFGLNLVAANRIFIIEPQWNPSVENQAIARAIRMKQKEKVQVTRYLIKDTVEQEMQSQQIKKRERAEFGFARKEGETNMAAHPESVEGVEVTLFVSDAEEENVRVSLPVAMLLD